MIVASAICAIPVRAQQASAASPREQLTQYVADLQKNPSDDALREKIIKLAVTLDPKPATPPEVDELAGRGKYILDHATSPADFSAAAEAFAKASLLAPWVPDYYFDQASMLEKSRRYQEAVKDYQFYLMTAPDAQDAKAVREKVGGLKYEIEQQEKADAAAQAQRQAELDAQRAREQAAEQARLQAEREEQQRLANLDPLVRSLNGAVYRARRSGRPDDDTYVVDGATIVLTNNQNGQVYRYPIDGSSFWILWSDTDPRDSCRRFYGTDNCGWLGTISPKAITWRFLADGRAPSNGTEMGYAIEAKRVK